MKIAACYVVHYGKEYLYHSMRSVGEFVDDIHIFYTAKPSFGFVTSLVCPDIRDELRNISLSFENAIWHDVGPFNWEGEHRDYAINFLKEEGYDVALVVDSDELWDPTVLYDTLKLVEVSRHRIFRVNMMHFWRSLKWVCHDAAAPVRFIKLNANVTDEMYIPTNFKAFHMGYAQSPVIIKYKQDIHGHKAEWRQGWFENVFLPWHPGMMDVHPTNVNFWNPVRYQDEDGTLEYLLGDHSYWNMEIIK